MPTYQVEYNGGTYRIESDTELTEDQIRAQLGQRFPAEHTRPTPTNQPTVGSTLKNIGAEAFGGISDMDNLLRTPVPLGAGIQAATGVTGTPMNVPTQASPDFHNSAIGRGVRFAAPAAVFPGQSLFGAGVNAGTGFASGLIDYKAEQAGLPWYERLPLTLAPTLAVGAASGATKASLRGSPDKAREMGRNISELESMGLKDYSISQVSPEGNARLPLLERGVSFSFGGQGPFQRLGKAQSEQLNAKMEQIAGGTADDAEAAGKRIWDGLFAKKTGWVSRAKGSEKQLWGALDAKFQNVKAVKVKALEQALDNLVASYDNPAIGQAVNADKVAAERLRDAIKGANGQMSYNDFIKLRRELGELQSGSSLIPSERGISANQAGKLWAAVMDDYRGLSKAVGGEAEFAAAHEFSKKYHETSRNFFKTIFGKEAEPTKVIDEIVSGNFQHPAKLRALRESLDPADFSALQEYVINRLGTPSGSKIGSFSLETFYTNYNNGFAGAGRSGKAAADAMFGKPGTPTRDALETMFKVAERTKSGSQILFNTSGTAGSGIAGASIMAVLGDLAKRSANLAAGAAAGTAITGGAVVPGVALGITGGAVLTNAMAKLFTSPRFARWLTKTALQSSSRLPSATVVLANTKLESDDLEQAKTDFLKLYDEYRMYGAAP